MRNAALQSCDLFVTKCEISITQFSYSLFMSSLNKQLPITKMMMMTTTNDTDDSEDNDYHSVQ